MTDRIVEAFLDTPIAQLCDYGLQMRSVNIIEDKLGIRVRALEGVTGDHLMQYSNFGAKQLSELREALRARIDDLRLGGV